MASAGQTATLLSSPATSSPQQTHSALPAAPRALRQPTRKPTGIGKIVTASTPNLSGLFSAHSKLASSLQRKASQATLTSSSLAAVPDATESYALASLNESPPRREKMPPTPRAGAPAAAGDDLALGDEVDVPGNMRGTVRFVGTVEGKKGTFAGVELHPDFAARGKNNGDVDGYVGSRPVYSLAQLSPQICMLIHPLQRILLRHRYTWRRYFPPAEQGREARTVLGHVDLGPEDSSFRCEWVEGRHPKFYKLYTADTFITTILKITRPWTPSQPVGKEIAALTTTARVANTKATDDACRAPQHLDTLWQAYPPIWQSDAKQVLEERAQRHGARRPAQERNAAAESELQYGTAEFIGALGADCRLHHRRRDNTCRKRESISPQV